MTYHALHDGLSDMIEGGRLREEHIPEDYQWLVDSLVALCNTSKTREELLIAAINKAMSDYDGTENGDFNPWAEHAGFPVSDWQYEVANKDTVLGYHEWMEHKKESQADDKELENWQIINSARDIYQCEDAKIDTDARVSMADGGAYVSAWVWVRESDATEYAEELCMDCGHPEMAHCHEDHGMCGCHHHDKTTGCTCSCDSMRYAPHDYGNQ